MAETKKPHYPNVYKHRSHRQKYAEGYGAEGAVQGKTGIGEFRSGPLADCQHGMSESPKDQTYKKADAVNKKQIKSNHKTKPNPY